MAIGAFALIDALGWKGIWASHRAGDAREAIRKLQFMRGGVRQVVKDEGAFFGDIETDDGFRPNPQFVSLSDAIAIGITLPEGVGHPRAHWEAVRVISVMVARILVLASEDPVPLAYRGCISFGDFEMEDSFLVGSAVDQAAEHSEKADAALVWLHPVARRIVSQATTEMRRPARHLLRRWSVPLKETSYESYVVSPFASAKTRDERQVIRRAILRTFTSGRVDIEAKRQKTDAFLSREKRRRDILDDYARRRSARSE